MSTVPSSTSPDSTKGARWRCSHASRLPATLSAFPSSSPPLIILPRLPPDPAARPTSYRF
jgi:hypothetical protein